jgi:hypothetical protein
VVESGNAMTFPKDIHEALVHAGETLSEETSPEGRQAILLWFDRLLDMALESTDNK